MVELHKTVRLYGRDGKFVKELELGPGFDDWPDVIFYGARAFRHVLRQEYSECSYWRAPEPEAKV